MRYLGSKNRIAKHLLPTMLAVRGDRPWVEPFVGGANMIDKVGGHRIGNDSNIYLIDLLIAVRDGWAPPENISKDLYLEIKKNPHKFPRFLVGFVGFCCSFGGIWFRSYASDSRGDNYAAQGRRSLLRQAPKLSGVKFVSGTYLDIDMPENSLIYCDPPYEKAASKDYKDGIDHTRFWEWCREKDREGHLVFVSEYNAPEDFTCLVEIEHSSGLCNKEAEPVDRVEKLFTYGELI